ncbi:MAG: phosphodiester glycosidase family protein, partial [Clostridiales bacterium]|nr:phosphodiester glycosidase family protein [Clostridiales bacterium]
MKKRKAAFVLRVCAAVILAATLNARNVLALSVVYERSADESLMRGVTFSTFKQVTDSGMRDVFLLKAPVDDPYIKIAPVESAKEYGLKETVKTLLSDSGAIAGVNGDFFGIAGERSLSFGPVFKDNQLMSVRTTTNADKNEYASFYIDQENNPFILYLKTQVEFLNDGKKNIEVNSINKISDMVMPLIITNDAMKDTKTLDERFAGTVKVVAENGAITKISLKGETVTLPEDGFALVMSSESADYFTQFYKVGQTAELKIAAGMDFSKISAAIGGGGRILLDGEIVHDGGQAAAGRQPRAAIGISQDKKTIMLVAVDGRSHSIGATHDEMGVLLQRFGAYNAMHLDGGGSVSMAVKSPGADALNLVNTPSDGAERKVINALGVFNESIQGAVTDIAVEPSVRSTFVGSPTRIDVYGLDAYENRVALPREEVKIITDDAGGVWNDAWFYPSRTGDITITAESGDLTSSAVIKSRQIVELRSSVQEIKTAAGEKTRLLFDGLDENAERTFIYAGITYAVEPPELGSVENGVFTAGTGTGWIECSLGGISTYIPVYVGHSERAVNALEGDASVGFIGYPDTHVTGSAAYSSELFNEGLKSAQMAYHFGALEGSQAAYMTFVPPVEIPGDPAGLKIDAYGNNSGFWLRGRLKDANGKEFTVDLAKTIDWEGWKTLQAAIPADARRPVKLDRLYVAALNLTAPDSGSLFFDNLVALYPTEEGKIITPEAPRYSDPLKAPLDGAPPEGAFDITLLSNTGISSEKKPANYDSARKKAYENIVRNSEFAILAGSSDVDSPPECVFAAGSQFSFREYKNAIVVNLSARNGGIVATAPWQWLQMNDAVTKTVSEHVIMVIDKNPLNFHEKEFELFHETLLKLRETGKNIIVVSSDGDSSSLSVKSGVRYLNAAGLWKADGTLNSACCLA